MTIGPRGGTTTDLALDDADGGPLWPPPGYRRALGRRRAGLPRGLVQSVRMVQSELKDEIAAEIQRQVADYGPHSGSTYLTGIRLAIAQAVDYFVDHLADPDAGRAELDETLRRIGRGEAYEGRTLEAVRASFSIGAGVAWKRMHGVAAGHGLPSLVLGELGDAMFEFMDSLGNEAARGYHEAQAQLSDAAHQWRGRVLDLVLAGTSAPNGELATHAAAGNWAVPETVAMIAVRQTPGSPLPSARMLHPNTLAKLHADEPVILHPAPLSAAARTELEVLFAGHRVAIGCDVPLLDAASSLRWARRALGLADAGLIPASAVIDCAEHMSSLWIHAEPLLADIVRRTSLAPLFREPPNSRRILGETLLLWIETMGASAPTLATMLSRHPQTIRYRMKRLRDLFGDSLDNPERLLEMYLGLRASGPLWNAGRPAPPISVLTTADPSVPGPSARTAD